MLVAGLECHENDDEEYLFHRAYDLVVPISYNYVPEREGDAPRTILIARIAPTLGISEPEDVKRFLDYENSDAFINSLSRPRGYLSFLFEPIVDRMW